MFKVESHKFVFTNKLLVKSSTDTIPNTIFNREDEMA